MTKEEKKAKHKSYNEKGKGLWSEFKAFINKGNALMLAVGVVIGGAFSAITTAFVNILLSVCTWAVPGGLKGLVTVLPALSENQAGVEGIGQEFTDLTEATIAYAKSQNAVITVDSDSFVQWQTALKSLYTLHGGKWIYNTAAIIDWGSLINAVISFFIIALVLFIIVKVYNTIVAKKKELDARLEEEYYQKHPEERPAPVVPEAPKPTSEELLTQILAELKKQNGTADSAKK